MSVRCYRVLPEGQCLLAHGVSSLLSGTSGGTLLAHGVSSLLSGNSGGTMSAHNKRENCLVTGF